MLKLRHLVDVHSELRMAYPSSTAIEPTTPTLTSCVTMLMTYRADKLFSELVLRTTIDHSAVLPAHIAGNIETFAVDDSLDLVIGYYDVNISFRVLGY